jgi:hypothetical protein
MILFKEMEKWKYKLFPQASLLLGHLLYKGQTIVFHTFIKKRRIFRGFKKDWLYRSGKMHLKYLLHKNKEVGTLVDVLYNVVLHLSYSFFRNAAKFTLLLPKASKISNRN